MDPTTFLFSLVPARYSVPFMATLSLCALIDWAFPQPRAGSPWIVPRKIVAFLALSWNHAANAVKPGSTAATVTNADLLEAVATRLPVVATPAGEAVVVAPVTPKIPVL